MKQVIFVLIALLIMPLGACTPIGVVGAGAAATGVAASSEGGLRGALSDAAIQASINDLWFRYDVDTFRKLDLTVTQGRVLVTGVVQNPEDRVEAVRLAWQPVGVKQVINEVQVTQSEGVVGFAKDTWITTRLRAAITLDQDVQSINYSIDTVQGNIYLMGVAQDQAELNRVVEIARSLPNVKRVVSYVKLAGEDINAQEVSAGNTAVQWSNEPAEAQPSNASSNASSEPVTLQPSRSNSNDDIESYQLPY